MIDSFLSWGIRISILFWKKTTQYDARLEDFFSNLNYVKRFLKIVLLIQKRFVKGFKMNNLWN